MPTVDVWNLEHEKVGTLDLADDVFGVASRDYLLWEVVKNQRARMRGGTASTKTRSAVSGTGKKPYKQKHTGRARQGSLRSPHMRGGGVAFGPHPRSYSYSVPKKVRKEALRTALSNQTREQKLVVVKDFELPEIKTKRLADVLKKFGLVKGMLVDAKINDKLKKSTRNLPTFAFRSVEGLNLVELLQYENLMISATSLKKLEGDLKP
jgi:50S ribosomal protein L4, bacterial/organelle